jgi:SAM-dependent methyltransferase
VLDLGSENFPWDPRSGSYLVQVEHDLEQQFGEDISGRRISEEPVRNEHDAFGHALSDYLQGRGRGFEVIERDDGYIDISGGRHQFLAEYHDWPANHRHAMRYAQGRVLDIGCGAGRHALYLQRKGFDVLGIDVSPLAIRVCRRRGLRQAKVMSVTQINPALGSFGTVLMLGANFGLLANPRRARWLLKRMHAITAHDARIIAESRDPYQTDNPFHRTYHQRNRRRSRLPGQVRIRVRYQRYTTPWFDYLFVSRGEMRKILRGSGWVVRRFLPPRGPLYVAVITKTA